MLVSQTVSVTVLDSCPQDGGCAGSRELQLGLKAPLPSMSSETRGRCKQRRPDESRKRHPAIRSSEKLKKEVWSANSTLNVSTSGPITCCLFFVVLAQLYKTYRPRFRDTCFKPWGVTTCRAVSLQLKIPSLEYKGFVFVKGHTAQEPQRKHSYKMMTTFWKQSPHWV